jgi:twinkle protein
MTPRELNDMLARDCESVCRMLLPNGKREGSEWRVGSISGEDGKSLAVHLTGSRAGLWADFASGGDDSGDLIDLWRKSKGLSMGDALAEVRDYLGVKRPAFERYKPKTYRKPTKPAGKVLAYLTQTRKLSAEAIGAYHVAANSADTEIVFPYLRDGDLVNVKCLGLERPNGKKAIRLEKDCEPCLFGWQAIPEDAREIVICEGEIDALSLWQYCRPALSVCNGAGSHAWIEQEFERLDRFDVIFVCFDEDEAGRKGAAEVIERLGRDRCRMVKLPHKDANECLQKAVAREEIDRRFANAQTMDPAELKSAGVYVDQVLHDFYPDEGEQDGLYLPWAKLREKLAVRRSELVVFNGINGHGKSVAVSHIALHAMKQGARVCMFSGEMRPWRLLKWATRQATGTHEPAPTFIRKVLQFYSDKLWMFELTGAAKVDRLLEVFKYARKRYGISLFVIDSLLKCGIDDDDYTAQKKFVEALCDFKNEFDVSVILVTHPRKGDDETRHSDKMDVRGAGAITDLCDTLLTFWRNKKREAALEKDPHDEDAFNAPGAKLVCQKQRNGEWEGTAWLWFDSKSMQFTETSSASAKAYITLADKVEA